MEKKRGRPKKYTENDKKYAGLRGAKLRYLREYNGYETIEGLTRDDRWISLFEAYKSVQSFHGLQKWETGINPINKKALKLISDFFLIPLELVEKDDIDIDQFKMMVNEIDSTKTSIKKESYCTRLSIKEINEIVERWKSENFSYSLVEKEGKNYIIFTNRNNTEYENYNCSIFKAFLFLVSIYNKSDWKKWTLLNKENEIAIHAAIEIFKSLHVRTRMRALYAMQYFGYDSIEKILEKKESQIDSINIYNIKNYVKNKTVENLLFDLSKGENVIIAKKANEVLCELEVIWGNGDNRRF